MPYITDARRSSAAVALLEACSWNIMDAAKVLKDEVAAAIDRNV